MEQLTGNPKGTKPDQFPFKIHGEKRCKNQGKWWIISPIILIVSRQINYRKLSTINGIIGQLSTTESILRGAVNFVRQATRVNAGRWNRVSIVAFLPVHASFRFSLFFCFILIFLEPLSQVDVAQSSSSFRIHFRGKPRWNSWIFAFVFEKLILWIWKCYFLFVFSGMSTREERAAERERYEREEKERRYFPGEFIQKNRPKQNFSEK